MKVGFIGTGIMGGRMAANLLKAGYDLVIHNRTAEKAQFLVDQGATWADSPAAVGAEADILFTMLAHPQAVSETSAGEHGFLHTMREGSLWVDSSTVNPSFTRQMAAAAHTHHINFLDAPVAGSKNQAADGVLVFFAGGEADQLDIARPLMEAMGSRVVHVGAHGMGISLKVVVNMLLATAMASFAEGLALGESLGLSKELLLNALIGGPVVAPFMASKKEMLATNSYDTEFPLKWMQKDLQMAAEAAYDTGAALPVANSAKELYQFAVQHNLGDHDFSAIYEFMKQ